MTRIIVVDDKEMMRDSVATILGRRGHTVVACASAENAITKLQEKRVDAIVTDLQMPGMNGLELLESVRALDEQVPVVLMTAYGTVETAVQAMKQGAFDYVTKPFSGDELAIAVDRALDHARLARENAVLKAAAAPSGRRAAGTRMVGSGASMRALRERIALIADSHGTVMVNGESGTGKEVAARVIHESSPRANQPFLALNCAALSSSLLESELFGHEKGAFTGADKLRKGRFELADGGTLLLDEISEIAPELQAKLLRVLQERTFERVGSSQPRTVDVRVIATTNRDLAAEVDAGRFRGDLFFRLNVLPVTMPALRDRTDDIDELATHFLELVAEREGRTRKAFAPEALALLRQYGWPGNVRELQNICERAAVLTPDARIEPTLVRPWLFPRAMPSAAAQARRAPELATAGGIGMTIGHGTNEGGSNGHAPFRPASSGSVAAEDVLIGVNGSVRHDDASHRAPADCRAAGHGPSPADLAACNEVATAENAPPTARLAPVRRLMACDGALTLEDVEREAIVATLRANRGHRARSAKALGIGVRTLGIKLKRWKELELVDSDL